MVREFADLDVIRGTGTLGVSLRASGGSIAEMITNLNGHARLLMDKGQMKTEGFDLGVGGLTSAMKLILRQSDWVVVECIANDFGIEKGLATARVNVIDSELAVFALTDKTDLGAETLDFKFNSSPKAATLNIAPAVLIRGTLAEPDIGIDPLPVARKIGGILGTVVFSPAAIPRLGELGASDNQCLKTASESASVQPQQSQLALPTEATPDAAREAIEDIGRSLRGILGR